MKPDYWGAYFFIGEVFEDTQRYEQAIIYYQQAIKVDDPSSYVPYLNLLNCYAASGRLEEGSRYFRQLIVSLGDKPIEKGTTSTMAHYALGMMCAYSGDAKAALDQYKILKAQGLGRPAELADKLFDQIYAAKEGDPYLVPKQDPFADLGDPPNEQTSKRDPKTQQPSLEQTTAWLTAKLEGSSNGLGLEILHLTFSPCTMDLRIGRRRVFTRTHQFSIKLKKLLRCEASRPAIG